MISNQENGPELNIAKLEEILESQNIHISTSLSDEKYRILCHAVKAMVASSLMGATREEINEVLNVSGDLIDTFIRGIVFGSCMTSEHKLDGVSTVVNVIQVLENSIQ